MPAASFPADFLWGVATAGHQNEGDNVHSDTWFLENVTPSVFQDRSGKATNGWELWESDLDLVAGMNLNAYRFSVEWARVEPIEGEFSEGAARVIRKGPIPVTVRALTRSHPTLDRSAATRPRSAHRARDGRIPPGPAACW